MDPVTLGIVAAALMARKGIEAVGEEAGKSLAAVVARLFESARRRLSGKDERAALEKLSTNADSLAQSAVANALGQAAQGSSEFAEQLAALVAEARRTHAGAQIVATAFDSAKQVNIAGDNSGQINM